MSGLLDGQVAVITGAAHGIGEATAELFVAEGAAAVYVTDLDGEGAEAVAARLGDRAISLRVDVCDGPGLEALRDRVVADHGQVDVLVNNAGHYLVPTSLELGTDEHWQGLYEVNLLHVIRATKLFTEPMLERGRGRWSTCRPSRGCGATRSIRCTARSRPWSSSSRGASVSTWPGEVCG